MGVPKQKMVSEIIQIDRMEPAAYTGAIRCEFVSDKYFLWPFENPVENGQEGQNGVTSCLLKS